MRYPIKKPHEKMIKINICLRDVQNLRLDQGNELMNLVAVKATERTFGMGIQFHWVNYADVNKNPLGENGIFIIRFTLPKRIAKALEKFERKL